MYAKSINNNLEYAKENYELENGSLIVNFNQNEELMKRYGFKKVVDIQPNYDVVTEYLTISGYTEDDDNIVVNYTINKINIVENESVEQKVEKLENIDIEIQLAIAEIYEMILGGK